MKKSSILSGAVILAVASAASAASPLALVRDAVGAASTQVASSSTTVLGPSTYQSYADAYDLGIGAAHYLVGTGDPNGVDCLGTNSCLATQTHIGRAAYIGSFAGAPNGNDMVSILVFDAAKLPPAESITSLSLQCKSVQNFTGQAYRLAAKIMTLTGDGLVDPGAQGAFDMRGPFGIPTTGSLQTIIVDGRGERADDNDLHAATSVAGRGPLVAHDASPGLPYLTFDRDVTVAFGTQGSGFWAAVGKAQTSGITYTTCRTSCLGPTVRNVDCDQTISNPLYVAVTALRGDAGSSRLIQAGLAVDNIISIHGDCDFAGDPFPGATVRCDLVAGTE